MKEPMKYKTSELTDTLLDAAVAKAEGKKIAKTPEGEASAFIEVGWPEGRLPYAPSTDWNEGGPIIEREGIELHCIDRNGRRMNEWMARHPARSLPLVFADTPLVAAMRAYVASKLGGEVEL